MSFSRPSEMTQFHLGMWSSIMKEYFTLWQCHVWTYSLHFKISDAALFLSLVFHPTVLKTVCQARLKTHCVDLGDECLLKVHAGNMASILLPSPLFPCTFSMKKDTLLAKSSLSLKPDTRIPVFPRMHLSYPRNRPCVDWHYRQISVWVYP